jgi:Na+/proline symporter/nitrogen-specific signal transduction histidine kinase
MVAPILIISISVGYVALLFFIAWIADKREAAGQSIVKNPAIYALSMAVYCTAWTFYGSVGRAATTGLGFLPSYLGPAILAPVWWLLLKKIILISKSQRITSIADFISSRYGKSTFLGIVATVIAVFGIVPYISIQLKAISSSFDLLAGQVQAAHAEVPFYLDTALYITIALAAFTILFGTRNLDPNERHGGLVAAIAFESVLKLLAFLAIGLFVTFGLYDGFGDIFSKGAAVPSIKALFTLESAGLNGWEWFWLLFLSMSAVMLLPRQFHVAVVENTDAAHVARASWMFPLYLLLINIFVLPIAVAGLLMFPEGAVEPDSYVLSIPLATGHETLALFVALGGFSAATSMVIVAVIALSIMIVNNLVLPALVRNQDFGKKNDQSINTGLLGIRRISIILVLLFSYAYFKVIGEQYSLVSVGLISFTAIAQFTPLVLGGIYWKRATKKGAIWGLSTGFLIWAFCLPLPTLVEANLINDRIMQEGLFGWSLFQPYALFGLEGYSPVTNAAFWSLLFNTFIYIVVSLNTQQSPLEVSQADLFVDIYKYRSGGSEYEVMRRRAKVGDLRIVMNRFLGIPRTQSLFTAYENRNRVDLSRQPVAEAKLINYAETHIAGAIGAASAKIIIGSIAREDPISLEEMFRVLEQTREIVEYSKALEKKSAELERTTLQLKQANEQLKELDRLKADFITTVTHELRTPITSIKALSKIMLDNKDMPEAQRAEFLSIVVTESERLTRLINQVLDLEKIQSGSEEVDIVQLDLAEVARQAFNGLRQLMREKGINPEIVIKDVPIRVPGNFDQLTQVVVNLLSNAIKFADDKQGMVSLHCYQGATEAYLEVRDNGPGISPRNQALIFEKFTQISDKVKGKPQGSGLGLFITHTIISQHQGRLSVDSTLGGGAIFKVALPLFQKPHPPAESAPRLS